MVVLPIIYTLEKMYDEFPAKVRPTVEKVFNMANEDGAKAIGMKEEAGWLKVRFRADEVGERRVWEYCMQGRRMGKVLPCILNPRLVYHN